MELGSRRQRKPSRIVVARRKRAARKSEEYILEYEFPAHVSKRVRRHLNGLDEAGWALVERGLREWFVCCAWRGRTMLGMPSRAVDEAWHEFILDSLSYTAFCRGAFGEYLHHTPDEAMATPMPDALAETVRAWDRSSIGADEESVLWDLDHELGIDDPFGGLSGVQLGAARSRSPYPLASGWACAGGGHFTGSCGGGGEAGGSGGDGGGGGGGCGGGCGGGGGS